MAARCKCYSCFNIRPVLPVIVSIFIECASLPQTGCDSFKLASLKIGAPADRAEVWGSFKVRLDYQHLLVPSLDSFESIPWGLEVLLDGEVALVTEVRNNTRNYFITIPALPEGIHVLEIALRYPGDDDPGSPSWRGGAWQAEDRARYFSHGDVPLPVAERVAVPGLFEILERTRVRTAGDAEEHVEERSLAWKVAETAVVVVDMWAYHGCRPAAQRVDWLAGKVNDALMRARDNGAFIVHVPSSGVEEMEAGYAVQRERMRQGAAWCRAEEGCVSAALTHAGQSIPPLPSEPPLPFQGGCEDGRAEPPAAWDDETHVQHPAIAIMPGDGLSDKANEIVGSFRKLNIRNVVLMGVHANECLLKRPFGLRHLAAEGFHVVLARDLTDVLYDPRELPHVSHTRGTEMVVEHIEAFVAGSIEALRDLSRARHSAAL